PHQVYNRPANEFVARFMGGHNVIDTPQGLVGVRTDHLQIAAADAELPGGAQRMPAVVTDVEYQGTYVLLGLRKRGVALSANATAAYSVMVAEAAFAARPWQVGQPVQLHWTPDQAHPLSAPALAMAA
ncbi:MAG: TOBE domain-containing protein, partial [Comamonas sp.]